MGMWKPWAGYRCQFNHWVRQCQQGLFASSHTRHSSQIHRWTRRDPLLSTVLQMYRALQYVQRGCPNVQPSKVCMSQFWTLRGELSTHEGCILWGSRVVVPLAGCKQLLQELHAVHQGMARMKSLACSLSGCWSSMQTCGIMSANTRKATVSTIASMELAKPFMVPNSLGLCWSCWEQ